MRERAALCPAGLRSLRSRHANENGNKLYSEIGPVTTYDLSIIWQVMSDCLAAAAILGVDEK